jgi:hypothetical protein
MAAAAGAGQATPGMGHLYQADQKEAQSIVPWQGLMVKIGRSLIEADIGKFMVRVGPTVQQNAAYVPNIFKAEKILKSKEGIFEALALKAVQIHKIDQLNQKTHIQVKQGNQIIALDTDFADHQWVEKDKFFDKLSAYGKDWIKQPKIAVPFMDNSTPKVAGSARREPEDSHAEFHKVLMELSPDDCQTKRAPSTPKTVQNSRYSPQALLEIYNYLKSLRFESAGEEQGDPNLIYE